MSDCTEESQCLRNVLLPFDLLLFTIGNILPLEIQVTLREEAKTRSHAGASVYVLSAIKDLTNL